MKVVVITEGVGEYKGLPQLYPQILQRCRNVKIVKTLLVNVSPDAPPAVVAKRCAPGVRMAAGLGASLVIVTLDREGQHSSSGVIANRIRSEIQKAAQVLSGPRIDVVIKDRKFENWLVADLDAMRRQPARYSVTVAMERQVVPDKADRCDGEALIKRAIVRGSYQKTEDSFRICSEMDVFKAAQNSRSFRHFLHVMGHGMYVNGCVAPVDSGADFATNAVQPPARSIRSRRESGGRR